MKQTMKKIWSCAILLAAVLLTGCNNEESLLGGEEPQAQTGKLSFVIPLGGNKTVTYATPDSILDGIKEEYEIKELFVYWFKETDGLLWDVFSLDGSTDSEVSLNPADLTAPSTPNSTGGNTAVATIKVGTADFESRFYIVANVNGTSRVQSKGLLVNNGSNGGGMTVNQSTWQEFEAKLSEALASGAVIAANENLATPLPMSIVKGGTTPDGCIKVFNPSTSGAISDVHLKRRVARFDILNHSEYSNFTITKVYVTKAQKQGWLHDVPFTGSESWKSQTAEFTVDGTNFNGTPLTAAQKKDTINTGNPTTAADSVADKIPDGFQVKIGGVIADSLERARAAFYLFPTLMKTDYSLTEIQIEGVLEGKTRLYKLDLSQVATNDTLKIEANKLYTIVIKRVSSESIDIALTVDRWEDGNPSVDIPASGTDTGVTDWGSATPSTGGAAISLTGVNPSFEYSSATPVTLTIENIGTAKDSQGRVSTISFSPVGTAGQDYLASDLNLVSDMDNVSSASDQGTYGISYKTVHTITLPPTDAPIQYTIKLSSIGNKSDAKTILVSSKGFNKQGPAVAGTILYANTLATGQGRFEKGVVITATGGQPTLVAAIMGTLPDPTDLSALPNNQSISQMISWLTTNPASFATDPLKATLSHTDNTGKFVAFTRAAAIQLRISFPSDVKLGTTNLWYNMLRIDPIGGFYNYLMANDDFMTNASMGNLNANLQSDTGIKVCGLLNW